MEYRTYRGSNIKEARLKMLMDAGRKAYIIDQKVVKEGGILGFGGKEVIEITAGILDKNPFDDTKSNNQQDNIAEIKKSIISQLPGTNPSIKPEVAESLINPVYSAQDNNKTKQDSPNNNNLQSEIAKIREMVSKMYSTGEIGKLNNPTPPQSTNNRGFEKNQDFVKNEKTQNPESATKKTNRKSQPENRLNDYLIDNNKDIDENSNFLVNKNQNNPKIEFVKIYLRNRDYDENFIEEIIKQLLLKDEEQSYTEDYIDSIVMDRLMDNVNLTEGYQLDNEKPTVVMLAGATGVGKTITIAKIAATFGVLKDNRVELLSIDKNKVGTALQLKLYSEIMGLDFYKINSFEDFKKRMDTSSADLILVDTCGLSPYNIEEIEILADYINLIKLPKYITLVLSAITKSNDLELILDNFSIIDYDNVLLTKLDETATYGPLISKLARKRLSLSYICFGQRVPEDLTEAGHGSIKQNLFDNNVEQLKDERLTLNQGNK